MLCPLCHVELPIAARRTVVTGDDSPHTPTAVYIEQDLCCRSPNCPNRGKVVATRRAYLVGADTRQPQP